MIIIPLRSAVLFPGVTSPITVGRASSVAAASAALRDELKVGFVLQRDAQKDDIGTGDLHRVGTAGTVSRFAGTTDRRHCCSHGRACPSSSEIRERSR